MTIKKRSVNILTALFLCLFISCAVSAGEKRVSLTFMQWPPFEYEEDGIQKGIDLEIVRTTLQNMGFQTTFTKFPWKRAYNDAKHGKADGVFSMGKRPEREVDFFYPSEPLIVSIWYLYFRKGEVVPFDRDYKDLKGLRIGVCGGYIFPKEFMESTLFQRDKSKDDLQNLKKLKGKRVDAIVCDNINCGLLIRKHGMETLFEVYEKTPIDVIPMYIGFSKKSETVVRYPNLASDFSATLKAMKKSGETDKIAEKYGVKYPARDEENNETAPAGK